MSGIVRSIGKAFSRIDGKQFVTGLAVAAGAYYLGGMATGSFADGTSSGLSSGDESAGLNMNPGDTSFAANASNESGGGLDMGGTTPLPTPSQEVSNMATPPDSSVQPGAFDSDGTPGYAPANTPAAAAVPPSTTPAVPAPTQAQAPVQSTPAPETPTPTGPASGPSSPAPAGSTTAQTPSAVKDLSTSVAKTPSLPQGTNVGQWFKSLSPAAQAAIAGGVAGGAGAVMNAIAAKNAQEFQTDREQRTRDDVIRRGAITAFGDGAIKPKRGIINSVRGQ